MKIGFALRTLCLLACLLAPRLVQAGGDRGQAPFAIGEKYFAKQEYPAALKYYRKALKRNDPRAYYRMGLIFEETGQDRDALNSYRRFIALGRPDPERSDSIQRVKAIEERKKVKTTKAAEPLQRRKTTKAPDARQRGKTTKAPDLLKQGKTLFMKGKYREAEAILVQAAAKDRSIAEIHFYLGEVYMKLEAYGQAQAEYVKAKKYY